MTQRFEILMFYRTEVMKKADLIISNKSYKQSIIFKLSPQHIEHIKNKNNGCPKCPRKFPRCILVQIL